MLIPPVACVACSTVLIEPPRRPGGDVRLSGDHPDRERDRVGGEDHERRGQAVGAAADHARQDDRAGQQPDPPECLEQVEAELRARLFVFLIQRLSACGEDPLRAPTRPPRSRSRARAPRAPARRAPQPRRARRRDSAGSASSRSPRRRRRPQAREGSRGGSSSRDVAHPRGSPSSASKGQHQRLRENPSEIGVIIAPGDGHGEWSFAGVEVGHLCRATLQTRKSARCLRAEPSSQSLNCLRRLAQSTRTWTS